MGKSSAKWIKTVLFGKKASKSNLSKGRELSKSACEEVASVTKEPAPDSSLDPCLTSQPVPGSGSGVEQNFNVEKEASAKLPNLGMNLSSEKQGGDAQTAIALGLLEDSRRIGLEQAALKAQAAFRGYQARRAFKALKGIVRLQAIVRGHLVRRQAVATLYCVLRIVKVQALVRGQKVRHSDLGSSVRKKQCVGEQDAKCLVSIKKDTSIRVEKLLTNAFARKLLSSSPMTWPLHLHYSLGEPNSAWDWLLRWTISHIWRSYSESRKIIPSKHGNFQMVETDQARPKHNDKVLTSNAKNCTSYSTSDTKKLRQNLRKVLNHPTKSALEHQPNEIGRVKRNQKKIPSHMTENSGPSEIDTGKPKRRHRKLPNSAAPNFSNLVISGPTKKVAENTEGMVSELSDLETCLKLRKADASIDELHDYPAVDIKPSNIKCGNEDIHMENKHFSSEDDQIMENQKTSRRRASLPGNPDYQENGLYNTPRVPSYMASTKSAMAKLRQVSQRLGQNGAEKNVLTRRHSLPSSTNGKLNPSPQLQRLVQSSGKGGIRSEKSLMSSTDGNEKGIRAEWRR